MVAWVVNSRLHPRRSLLLRHGDKKACHAPQFSSFRFIYFRTLSFSVSSKSFACHSYENCRVSHQQFPLWNSTRARPRTPFPMRYHLSLFLSYSCTLFCTHENVNSFVFRRFRTLSTKTPPVGRIHLAFPFHGTRRTHPVKSGCTTRTCCLRFPPRFADHEPQITNHAPPVAPLHPQCYDLVFYDPR